MPLLVGRMEITMKMKKEELRNLAIVDFALWLFIFIILKIYKPEFAYLSELISAITNRNILVIFYIPGIMSFILITYVMFICGFIVVFDETVGRIISVVRRLLGKNEFEKDKYNEFEIYYNKEDLMIIAIYIFLVLPVMFYLIFPALTSFMIGIFILYLLLQFFG